MTTFAWDGMHLAADSQMTVEGSVIEQRPKVETLESPLSKVHFAAAGTAQDAALFAEWIRKGRPADEKPFLDDGFVALVVMGGEAFEYEDKLVALKVEPPYAAGSGWKWALAAMDHGKSAIRAVEYACTRDIRSGLPITYVRTNCKGG